MPEIKRIDFDNPPDLSICLACPFCSSDDLRVVDWCDDSGEYYAIECSECLASAPADKWNTRFGVHHAFGH